MDFFYVKLPIGPKVTDREQIFHEGLDSALTAEEVGSVLGWGSSLSRMKDSEPAHLAFHRVDIDITDFQPARAVIQRTLVALDAPDGTEIHYTVNGTALQDISSSDGWRTEPCITSTRHTT